MATASLFFIVTMMVALAPFAASNERNQVYEALEPSYTDDELHMRKVREVPTEPLHKQLENLLLNSINDLGRSVRSAEEETDRNKETKLIEMNQMTPFGLLSCSLVKGEDEFISAKCKLLTQFRNALDLYNLARNAAYSAHGLK